jgi:hypothetical protein
MKVNKKEDRLFIMLDENLWLGADELMTFSKLSTKPNKLYLQSKIV